MNRFFFLLLFLFFGNVALAQKLSPLEYHDKIISITDSLHEKGMKWGQVLNECSQTQDCSVLKEARLEMMKLIERKIKEIKQMKDVGKGAGELRDAMIEFLVFENKLVEDAFTPFEKLVPTSSQTDYEVAIANLNAVVVEEEAFMKKLDAAQAAYGEKNGFTIQKR